MQRNPRRYRNLNKKEKSKVKSKEKNNDNIFNSNKDKYEYENVDKKLNLKKVFVFILLPILIFFSFLGFKNLKPFFSSYNVIRKNPTKYFTSYKDGLWGVIDSNGNKIIDNEYKEMIVIPNEDKDVFIVTYDIQNKNEFSTRAINKNNNSVIKQKNVYPIQYMDEHEPYDKNLLIFKENNLYGLIDYEGNVKAEAKYSNIEAVDGVLNRILVEEEGKKGIINTKTFETVVAPVYKNVEPINKSENTAFVVVFDDYKGITSSKNKTILPAEYNEVLKTDSNKYFAAKKNNILSIFDETGKEVVNSYNATPINILDNIIISRDNNGKVGAHDFNKEIVIPFQYDEIKNAGLNTFITGINGKYNISKFYSSKKDVKSQEKDQKNILPKDYINIEYVSEGNFYIGHEKENAENVDVFDADLNLKLSGIIEDINYKSSYIKIKNGKTYKYYLFNFQEKTEKEVSPQNNLFLFEENGKLGFVNEKNNIIVPAIYDDAKTQNDFGYIAVSRNNKWGVLDYTGNVLVEPSLDLSKNLKIEFIKNYYLSENLELHAFKEARLVEHN